MFAAIASQKNHMAVYLSGIYSSDEFRENFITEYKNTGKRMDLGKSCVRFRKIEDLPLEVIGKAISEFSIEKFVEIYSSITSKKSNKSQK